jgi:hypothetical protein
MTPRSEILTIPNRAPYLTCALPGRDPHAFRTPSLAAIADMLRRVEAEDIAALEILAQVETMSTLLAVLARVGPSVCNLLGWLLGDAWAHPTLALDAIKGSDGLVYGRAVFEELHSAGYSLEETLLLAMPLIDSVMRQSRVSTEVQERLRFFGRQRVPNVPETSDSGTSTAEIPLPSTG